MNRRGTDSVRDDAETQRRYFEEADEERFAWTTAAVGFAETEDDLLAPLLRSVESPCLEVGCGEGNNLVRLSRHARCVGVDLFRKKLLFASERVPGVRLVNADAGQLPFRAGAFATVFIRDLLHHVPEPLATLREAVRTLRPGGRLCLLEPNGRNPLVLLQTLLVHAEAKARAFDAALIRGWLGHLPLSDVELQMRQALPLRRMVLHYRFGSPRLGRNAAATRALRGLEAFAGRLLPASRWSYISATARLAGSDSGQPTKAR
jgi:SAM-dependent methyltransferase